MQEGATFAARARKLKDRFDEGSDSRGDEAAAGK